MTGILAVETATEACSLAYSIRGESRDKVVQRHEIAPRRHNQLLFQMMQELVPTGAISDLGIDYVAYGCGPGSFTGLRIAASFAQGLAYSCGLPAVPVSTLAILAQSALHEGIVSPSDTVLATLDARINEVYAAVFVYREGIAVMCEGPWVGAPAELSAQLPARDDEPLALLGSGCRYLEQFPSSLRDNASVIQRDVWPRAADMFPLVRGALAQGNAQQAHEILPVYVQEEISWKKLHEQGRSV